jgi:precorrin-6A/cobalt-precorrin-6A reductase
MPAKILILGGTAEAVAMARRLTAEGADVITSLAGRLGTLPALPGRVHVGGFGGAEGLQDFLRKEAIDRVIDLTHPFAASISRHAREACAASGVPLECEERPIWRKRPGDLWHWAEDAPMAARMAPRLGRCILLTVGAKTIPAFFPFGGPSYVIRLIEDPVRLPLPRYRVVLGKGPFTVADEIDLLRRFAVDLLVTKASGGMATEAKIIAARHLGIPVVLIRRPESGEGC